MDSIQAEVERTALPLLPVAHAALVGSDHLRVVMVRGHLARARCVCVEHRADHGGYFYRWEIGPAEWLDPFWQPTREPPF